MSYELRGLGQMASGDGVFSGLGGGLGYMASGDGVFSGLGSGLGATGVSKLGCPKSTSTLMPAGLSAAYLASYPPGNPTFSATLCNENNAVAQMCNKSAQPALCYWGKLQPRPVKSFLGRASTAADWEAWAAWTPSSGNTVSVSTDPTTGATVATPAPGGMDDTTFYALLAAGAAGAVALVWYIAR